MTQAEQIVDKVITCLENYAGFDDWWYLIDTQDEIYAELVAAVQEQLTSPSSPSSPPSRD